MVFKNADIVTETEVITGGFIEIEAGRIRDYGPAENAPEEGRDLEGKTIMAGFIDTHIHGVKGDDFADGDERANARISENLVEEGVSAFLATTTTMAENDILKALRAAANSQAPQAKNLGIHLEGPFINEEQKGAQNAEYIRKGSLETFERFQEAAKGRIKIVTLAPEVQDEAFLKALAETDVTVSMGHSSAKADDVKKALALGIKRVTHCFNAMRGIHHRDLGLAGMALLEDSIMAEAIADNIHLSPDTLKLLVKTKGAETITLVSDAIRAKGLPDGTYTLGGLEVSVKEGVARLENGALAGSTLALDQALRNMQKATKAPLPALSRMLSLNPAQTLGIDEETGAIEKGKAADLVILDADFRVAMTLVDGEIAYER